MVHNITADSDVKPYDSVGKTANRWFSLSADLPVGKTASRWFSYLADTPVGKTVNRWFILSL